jgi:hypothetical protein
MTDGPNANGAPAADEERAGHVDVFGLEGMERRVTLDWIEQNLPLVRRSAFGQRMLYWSLGIGVVLGLAAQVGGYLLKTSVTTEPLGLVADLLYALGWSLWTGAVVAVFIQIIPEVKRRQYERALDAYEAARREEARAESSATAGPATG